MYPYRPIEENIIDFSGGSNRTTTFDDSSNCGGSGYSASGYSPGRNQHVPETKLREITDLPLKRIESKRALDRQKKQARSKRFVPGF